MQCIIVIPYIFSIKAPNILNVIEVSYWQGFTMEDGGGKGRHWRMRSLGGKGLGDKYSSTR